MITIQLTKKPFLENDVEGFIFLLKQDFEKTADLLAIEKEYYPHLLRVLQKHKFIGKEEQTLVLTGLRNDKLVQLIFVGLGKQTGSGHGELEGVRRALGHVIKQLKKLEVKDAVVQLPSADPFGISHEELVKQMALACNLADYEFVAFKADKKGKSWAGTLLFSDDLAEQASIGAALNEGVVIGQAMNEARELIDLPGNIITPKALAQHAQTVAQKEGLTCTVFGREKALELGMGGFCAVDAGSDQEGQFIILEYITDQNAPTIALVGKGVTFDTGGISLKPSNRMSGMKYDMSGAAAVLTVAKIASKLKMRVNVIAIAPTVENMPSGKAARQDDIITFMNGTTAEISNTDAEGRLILADGLSYAEKMYKPNVIIDVATLTGACEVALGHFYAGLMGRDDALNEKLKKCGQLTGDKVWQLPFDEDYKKGIESKVADINNSGSARYSAGVITAGFFLSYFVKQSPWAHLDIAGVASDVPGVSYLGEGATGASIRLLTEFVQSYTK